MSKRKRPNLSPAGDTEAPRWLFGPYALDENRRELRRGDTLLKLEPKPLDLLMLLLRHAGELVTKEELIESIWAGRVVTENVIARCVTKLREALGEEGDSRIVTVHGYGYRFVGDVSRRRAAEAPALSGLLYEGYIPHERPNWRLEAPLDAEGRVWRARHDKTRQLRVFKFAHDAAGLAGLKRETTLYRVLAATAEGREHVAEILDWNFDESPWFLELQYEPLGSLQDWLAAQGGAAAVPLETRLELIAQAAAAVAAAHALGVLHKDVKPANVFLRAGDGPVPQVRLGDFGSGRIDAEHLHALEITRLGFTQTVVAGQESGATPLYIAPELLTGTPPTTRSDIYALGVMLYQIVVGDLRRPLAPGWEREVEDPLLREDIALAADVHPAHRLGDAASLAERLRTLPARRAQLAQRAAAEARQREAIEAGQRAQTELRRLRMRRRWQWAMFASLAAGLGVSTTLYLRARAAEQRAQLEAQTVQAVNQFVNDDLLGAANPYEAGGGSRVTVASVLDAAAASLQQRFADQPQVRWRLTLTIAEAYAQLGLEDRARDMLAAVIETSTPRLDETRAEGRTAMTRLARLDLRLSRPGEARAIYGRLDGWTRAHLPADSLERLDLRRDLAWATFEEGYFARAKTDFETLRDDVRRLHPDAENLLLDIDANLVEVYMETQDWDLSAATIDSVIARIEQRSGSNSTPSLWPKLSKVYMLRTLEQWQEAETLAREVLDQALSSLGENHPVTISCYNHLGTIRLRQGQYADARQYFQLALDKYRAIFGEDNYRTRRIMNRIGEADIHLGRTDEARGILESALANSNQRLGEDHPHSLDIARLTAEAYAAGGALEQAEARFRRVLELAPRRMPPNNNRTVWACYGLGRALLAQQRPAEAEPYLRQAYENFLGNFGPQHSMTLAALSLLGATAKIETPAPAQAG